MKHLGVQPGGKIRLDLLPDGRAELESRPTQGSWRSVYGMLKGNGARLTIDDIEDAIAKGGPEAASAGLDDT